MSTLVLGASQNTTRYSYKATKRLLDLGKDVILIGEREGEVAGCQNTNRQCRATVSGKATTYR